MSKSLSVLITIIIMIVLAGIGYYFLNQNFQNQKDDLQAQITDLQNQVKTSESTPTSAVDTSDWKTYTNTKFGYVFKYPSDYTLDNPSESTEYEGMSNSDTDVKIFTTNTKTGQALVEFSADQPVITLADRVQAREKDGSFTNTNKITLNGATAYEGLDKGLVASYSVYAQNENSSFINIIFYTKNSTDFATSKANLSDIQKAILASFQFTK